MNSKQRTLATIRQQIPDTVPCIPQAHVWALYHYGSSANDCMWDGDMYADIQIQAQRDFGWDGVFVATDSCALADSLGLEVLETEMGAAPGPVGILASLDDVNKLELIDPTTTRLNEWIKATRRLVDAIGDDVAIFARADAGPFSLAAQLRGMESFLLDVGESKHPEQIHALLAFCTEYALSFAKLLLEAGAPIVTIGDALASGSLISPATFERYALPYQQEMARRIHAMGGLFSIHVCGRTTRAFPLLVSTGADVLEFDALTDFDVALNEARGHTCLLGNVPVSEVMTMGTPADVHEEVRWRMQKVKPNPGYILSSGCALSSNAPAENLHALMAAGREMGSYT